jgi:hypothetical protein
MPFPKGRASPRRRDITGQRFGRLIALKRIGRDGPYQSMWLCRCDCGKKKSVPLGSLTSNSTKSCGCLMRDGRSPLDITGQLFGRLLAIKRIRGSVRHGGSLWLCLCICGELAKVEIVSLRTGHTKSCGCIVREGNNVKHGATRGRKLTPEYRAWAGILNRCYNQNNARYHDYGGRGITVHDSWRTSFQTFLNDVGQKPAPDRLLDRIDPDGNYEPLNCRWATGSQSAINQRRRRIDQFTTEELIDELRRRRKSTR